MSVIVVTPVRLFSNYTDNQYAVNMNVYRILFMVEPALSEKPFTSIIRFNIMPAMPVQSKPHIRPMTTDDLDAVLSIEQASFPTPWRREHFAHELAAPHSFPFVTEYNGIIGGYVCLMSLFEEAQILDIAVAPELRGRGMARLLMDHAISVARKKEAEVLALEVRASNFAAITLYERCGFVRTGIRSKYYEGVDDAVLMEMSLK
jgi:ribosomal-protein-alanine N-acetyltransferase